jgi:iron(III) transport system ATP-binding protein
MSPPERPLEAAVQLRDVAQVFGDNRVLTSIDLTLDAGHVLALLGPSGCGKTTLLKLVAGLLAPSAGTIRIFDKTVADAARGVFAPPERRDLGMVFQDYALWPHLTVGGNVAFPLEMRGRPRSETAGKVAAALARVSLAGFEQRSPASLSGGQQQRVAIARAIIAEPRIVLFDEPLSNLDRELRESLVGEIATLVRSLGLTAIYVTHDQSEAFALADSVAVMSAGRIAQIASPEELVDRPSRPEVAELLNLGPLATAERRQDGWWLADAGLRLAAHEHGPPPNGDGRARVLLARKAIRLASAGPGTLPGMVVRSQFRGDQHVVTIRLGNSPAPIEVSVASEHRASTGENVNLAIDTARLRWFPHPYQQHPSSERS